MKKTKIKITPKKLAFLIKMIRNVAYSNDEIGTGKNEGFVYLYKATLVEMISFLTPKLYKNTKSFSLKTSESIALKIVLLSYNPSKMSDSFLIALRENILDQLMSN